MSGPIVLNMLDDNTLANYEARYNASGELFLPNVMMPLGCNPGVAEMMFYRLSGACNVYVPSGLRYSGQNPFWKQVCSRPPTTQTTRLVLSVKTGMRDALRRVANTYPQTPTEVPLLRARQYVDPMAHLTDIPAALAARTVPETSEQPQEELLFERLRSKVRGQDSALRELSTWVSLHTAKRKPQRPLSIFMAGGTGNGKTESSKQLYKALKGSSPSKMKKQLGFHRLDMAEFTARGSVSNLLGAPPSFKGYGEKIPFLEVLRDKSRAIVLFDEIEKAHSSVITALLAVLDEGRITPRDSKQSTIECRGATFIFSSNLGADALDEALIRDGEALNPDVCDHLCRQQLVKGGIRRELVGRMTRCIYYQPLTHKAVAEVIALSIVAAGEEFDLTVSYIAPGMIAAILDRMEATSFGARTYKHAVNNVLSPLFRKAAAQNLTHIALFGPPFSYAESEPNNQSFTMP